MFEIILTLEPNIIHGGTREVKLRGVRWWSDILEGGAVDEGGATRVVMGTVVGTRVRVPAGTRVMLDEAVGMPVGVQDVFVVVVALIGTSVGTGDVPMDVGIIVGAPVGIILGMTGASLNVDGYDHLIIDLAGIKGDEGGVGATG